MAERVAVININIADRDEVKAAFAAAATRIAELEAALAAVAPYDPALRIGGPDSSLLAWGQHLIDTEGGS